MKTKEEKMPRRVRLFKFTSLGKLIDHALEAVEKENLNGAERHGRPSNVARKVRAGARIKLKNVLNKNYTQLQIDPANLAGLIDLIATIPSPCSGAVSASHESATVTDRRYTAKDILGHDPKSSRSNSFSASLGDLCALAVQNSSTSIGDIMVFGQDQWAWGAHLRRAKRARRVSLRRKQPNQCNPTTWRLAAMNMAIRGIDFDFGKEPADTFTRDQHPDLRADFVMALPSAAARSLPRSHPADRSNGRINPPFNIKDWWDGKLEGDARWNRSEAELASHAKFYKNRGKYGTPPQGNANFAWVQHMLHHLAPNGSMALLLANGSMSSNSSGEGDIRRALIEADLVECMVALPGQLFTNTQIPACIWFLTKNKAKRSRPGAAALRDRRGQTLFIDARKLGFMKDRVLRDFTLEDIEKIVGTFREWRTGSYDDVSGFCKSANLQEITANGSVLTPGRFVGAEDIEDDGEPFDEKMPRLVADLISQFKESAGLEMAIKANLKELGYGE